MRIIMCAIWQIRKLTSRDTPWRTTGLHVIRSELMVIRMDQRVNQRVATQVVRKLSEQGLDNADLAGRLGMSETTLLRRLTSQVSFTIAELSRVATTLRCSLTELLPGDGPDPTRQTA